MFFCKILTLFLGVSSVLLGEPLSLSVEAEAAFLLNPDNGAILYEKNGYAPYYPASITKIVTAAWALKLKGDKLESEVTASADSLASSTEEQKKKSGYTQPSWWLVPGTANMGIKKGEILLFKDLLMGMMVRSAGDAANVIAEYAGGSIPQFIKGMNLWVKSLGCKGTHFENPHGLFHPDQITTASDMALIMKEALKIPFFKELISKTTYIRPKTNKQPSITLAQTNRLMKPGPFYYSKAFGGKTGYLASSLNTFVAVAKDQERTLIAVFLKVKERTDLWKDSIKLFETAFNQPKIETILMNKGLQDFFLEEKVFETSLLVTLNEEVKISYFPAEAPVMKGLLFWNSVTPPILKGDAVGQFHVVDAKDQVLKAYTLFAANDIKGTWTYQLKQFFFSASRLTLIFRWGLIILALIFLFRILSKTNRRKKPNPKS